MNRNQEKVAKGIVVGLGGSLLLAMGALTVLAKGGAVSSSTDDGKTAKATVKPRESPGPIMHAPSDYAAIGKRNLFQPLTSARDDEKPVVVEEAAARVETPAAASAEPRTRTPLDDRVAVVGAVHFDGIRHAVMEDFGRGETRFVRVGDSAFGYRLARIEDAHATLERDGKTFRLALGDNKPERGVRGGSGGGPSTTTVASLPANLQGLVDRLLPAGGTNRVRASNVDGQPVYRVDTKVDGLDHEVQLATDGRVLRRTHEIRHDEVPSQVQSAANSALEGYRINPNNPPEYRERNGQRYYQIELMPADGGRKIDLNIAADGTVLGRG